MKQHGLWKFQRLACSSEGARKTARVPVAAVPPVRFTASPQGFLRFPPPVPLFALQGVRICAGLLLSMLLSLSLFFPVVSAAATAGTTPASTAASTSGSTAATTASPIAIATAYAADNFQTQNLQMFADDVARATAGKVTFRLYPAGSLLKPVEIFAGVRAGRAGGGEMMMSSLTHEATIFGIDALPFIVSDYDDARRLWQASRAAVERALAGKDLQLLYAVPWPGQNLYSAREIRTVRDFKGLAMRSYNQTTERIAELVGARPVTVQVIDLARAIEQQKLDLMLTSSWTGVDARAWTRLRHYYKVNAWIPKNMVFIDRKLFAGFDAATRATILEAARVAETRGWKMSAESDRRYESQLAAKDMNISTLDFFLRSYLDRMGENLARDWLRKAGPEELAALLKYTTERSMK